MVAESFSALYYLKIPHTFDLPKPLIDVWTTRNVSTVVAMSNMLMRPSPCHGNSTSSDESKVIPLNTTFDHASTIH
jgi:hypothetical protein